MARPTDDPKTGRIDLRLPPRVVAGVDEWRRVQDDIPARSEAMRRLIELGLKAEGQIDRLEEDIAILRAVAREWALKAGADQKVLDAINSDDPGAASSNGLLRKVPRSALLDPQSHVRSLGFRRASYEDSTGQHHPRQSTPKKPQKG